MIRAALVVGFVLVGGLAVQTWRLDGAQGRVLDLSAKLDGYREADKFRLKLQAAAVDAAALDLELSKGSGADAGLSDYMRGASGRVWP